MSGSIEVARGECLRAEGAWTDDEGAALDLTGRTIRISEAYPMALTDGEVTVTDATSGKFDIFIPAEVMSSAGRGRVNWIRVEMSVPDGCADASERIWVEVV